MFLKSLYSFIILSFLNQAMAGSCCGGGGSSTELMIGDTKSVWRTSYIDQTILADTDQSGKIQYRPDNQLESLRTVSLSFSQRINSFWQWGANIPIIDKTRKVDNNWQSLSGLGDVKLNLGYEFLPEFNRSTFISQGFIFAQMSLPTAPSIYTTKRTDSLDTRGTGHFLYTFGGLLKKRQSFGQMILNLSLTFRPGQEFKDSFLSDESIQTESSLDHLVSLSQDIDITEKITGNLTISRNYTRNKITSVFSNSNQESLSHPLSIGVNYSTDNYSYALSYTDEMLIPASYGHTLGRSFTIGIIKRINL